MPTLTPKLGLKKPAPNTESDWGFRLNESLDILDEALLVANLTGAGGIDISDDGLGNVTIARSDLIGADVVISGSQVTVVATGTVGLTLQADASPITISTGDALAVSVGTTVSITNENGGPIAITSDGNSGTVDISANGTAGAVNINADGSGLSTIQLSAQGALGTIASNATLSFSVTTGGASTFSTSSSAFSASVPVRAANGSAATPSYSFGSDPDIGVYRSAANVVGIATAGVERVTVSGTGLGVAGNITGGTGTLSRVVVTTNGSVGTPSIAWTGDPQVNTGLYLKANNLIGVGTGAVEQVEIGDTGVSVVNTLTANQGVFTSGLTVSGTPVSIIHPMQDIIIAATSATGAAAWNNMPAALSLFASSSATVKFANLTHCNQVRLLVNKGTTAGVAGSAVRLRYATSFSTSAASYVDIGTTGSPEVAVDTTATYLDSGWHTLLPAAKTEVFLGVVGSGGDGATDPAFGHVHVWAR